MTVIGDLAKSCGRCRKVKPVSAFNQERATRDGFSCWCRDCKKEYKTAYDKANRSKHLAMRAEWGRNNRDRRNQRARERRANDPVHALRMRVSCSVRYALRRSAGKGGKAALELVGWTAEELKKHLERQFLPGMTWGNAEKWHVDHIVPLASFKITGPECPEFRRAWALTNLRPLWAELNVRKQAKREFLL